MAKRRDGPEASSLRGDSCGGRAKYKLLLGPGFSVSSKHRIVPPMSGCAQQIPRNRHPEEIVAQTRPSKKTLRDVVGPLLYGK